MRVRPWLSIVVCLPVVCQLAVALPLAAAAQPARDAGLVLQQVLAVDRVAESVSLTPAADLLAMAKNTIHTSSAPAVFAGAAASFFLRSGGAIQAGTPVSVVIDGIRLEAVDAQS